MHKKKQQQNVAFKYINDMHYKCISILELLRFRFVNRYSGSIVSVTSVSKLLEQLYLYVTARLQILKNAF